MGKYQLDYKGQAQVTRFHEKHSTGKSDKTDKLKDLKARFIAKTTKETKR